MGNYIYKKPTKIEEVHEPDLIYIAEQTKSIPKKIFVFDLDETIGSFSDLYSLWNPIFKLPHTNSDEFPTTPTPEKQRIFNYFLDLYPEFLRPGIIQILTYLKKKIQENKCHKIHIYTNNQCEDSTWVNMIIQYLDRALNADLVSTESCFANPICAFKIKNRIIEHLRTTKEKTYSDFVKCSILPKSFELCFVDDTYYEKMANKKVFYIQPPPYHHHLTREEIMDRFANSDLKNKIFRGETISIMPKPSISLEYVNSKNQKDIEIFHKIMYYIKEFFIMTLKPHSTRRHRRKIGKFTYKKKT